MSNNKTTRSYHWDDIANNLHRLAPILPGNDKQEIMWELKQVNCLEHFDSDWDGSSSDGFGQRLFARSLINQLLDIIEGRHVSGNRFLFNTETHIHAFDCYDDYLEQRYSVWSAQWKEEWHELLRYYKSMSPFSKDNLSFIDFYHAQQAAADHSNLLITFADINMKRPSSLMDTSNSICVMEFFTEDGTKVKLDNVNSPQERRKIAKAISEVRLTLEMFETCDVPPTDQMGMCNGLSCFERLAELAQSLGMIKYKRERKTTISDKITPEYMTLPPESAATDKTMAHRRNERIVRETIIYQINK